MADTTVHRGLLVPSVFFRLTDPVAVAALQALATLPGCHDPRGQWFIADNLLTYGHTRGFLTEPRFVEAVLAARPGQGELAIVWRTHTLCWAAQSADTVAGDYVECGTYQGYSAEVLLHYMVGLPERQLWLYDVFDPPADDGVGRRLPAHAPGLADRVRRRFQPWSNVRVIQGKVPQILADGAPERIAFLHLDMNNAEAERGALAALYDRVSPGGIIVFDDYGWTGYRAQKAAADEFMHARGLGVLELPTGQGLVVKR